MGEIETKRPQPFRDEPSLLDIFSISDDHDPHPTGRTSIHHRTRPPP
jgi:hypothetical protein